MVPSELLLSMELPAEASSIAEARRAVDRVAAECGAERTDVALAVTEAVTNAYCHGYRGDADGEIRVYAELRGGQLVVAVVDRGVGMSPHPDWDGFGMGLPLIGRLSSPVHFEDVDPGVCIRMYFDTH
jgi:anti-sigma regulatory factor (Ser/Thr protein kinase)